MKEIIIIADSDPRKKVSGGVGVYSYNLTKLLLKKGYKIIFIGKRHEGDIIFMHDHLEFIELNKKPWQSNYVFLKNLFKLSRNLKINVGTIIHSQRPDWLVPFRNFPNKKIITLHGSHSKNVLLKKGFFIKKLYDKLEEKGLQIADSIVSVSDENTLHYKKMYPKLASKIFTIPVGIDIERFKNLDKLKSRRRYGFEKNDKVVIYAGRLEKEKNLKLLIDACNDLNLKLLIIGNGREEKNLKEYAKKLNSRTYFHDSVDNAEMPRVLACGNVFGLTSLHEGLPTVVIEAIACGLPVVSTDVGDIRKLVIENKTGFIVDEENIRERLKILIGKNSINKKKSSEIVKKYSWDNVGNEIIGVYEK